jgi:hypothetical protein
MLDLYRFPFIPCEYLQCGFHTKLIDTIFILISFKPIYNASTIILMSLISFDQHWSMKRTWMNVY